MLLIDDGSPNTSPAICDEYAAKDSRVRVIHKPNGGLCSALNTGLDNVTGNWVAFIDNDDWISPEMYQSLFDNVKDETTDIVYSDFSFILKDGEQCYHTYETGMNNVETIHNMLLNGYGGLRWHMIFRKSLLDIDKLRLPKLSVCEDVWYVYQLFLKARGIVKVPKALYHYNMVNSESITFHRAPEFDDDYIWCWEYLRKKMQDAGVWEALKDGVIWRVQLLKSDWVLLPEKYGRYHQTWPESKQYTLSNPFLHRKMKIAMWLLDHHITLPLKVLAMLKRS